MAVGVVLLCVRYRLVSILICNILPSHQWRPVGAGSSLPRKFVTSSCEDMLTEAKYLRQVRFKIIEVATEYDAQGSRASDTVVWLSLRVLL